MRKLTLTSKDSNSGIEREDVRILQLMENLERYTRCITTNKTRGDPIVLMGS